MTKLKSLSLLLGVGVLAVSLASCTPETVTTTTTTTEEPPATTTTTSEDSLPEWVDYVHSGEVQLTLDYEGHDFYQDGIGQMTLQYEGQCIDGDTVHFTPLVTTTSSERIKSRFYGVDTPESTGQIQMWGKEASDFTHEKVWNAAQNGTIVLSSPYNDYHKPETDSTGERYVTLVWINETKKNAPKEELVLLNLWLVQEGYSTAKNVTDFPEMATVFVQAETQAIAYKLHMHSDEIPPSWPPDGYQVVSLLDLKKSLEQTLENPNYDNPYDGKRIIFTGTVAGYANNILYLVQHFSEEEGGRYPGGEYAGINIFCGMSQIPSKYSVRNTYLEIHGTAILSNFGFQISDVQGRFPNSVSYSEHDAKILRTAEENAETEDSLHVFEYTAEELNDVVNATDLQTKYECLNAYVQVSEPLTVQDVYVAASDEVTLYLSGCDFDAYVTFMYAGDPNNSYQYWVKEEDWIGKRLLISGLYVYHDSMSGRRSWQINPCSPSDVVWVDAPSAE